MRTTIKLAILHSSKLSGIVLFLDRISLATKKIIGYALSRTPDAQLAKQAIMNAITFAPAGTRKLIFSSDHGVQYSTYLFKRCSLPNNKTQNTKYKPNRKRLAYRITRFFRRLKINYLDYLAIINHHLLVNGVTYYIQFIKIKECILLLIIWPSSKSRLCSMAYKALLNI